MNKQFSQYLDLLRILAASLVLLAHVTNQVFTNGNLILPQEIGYSSVMIFFVLSGYVITYVACEKELTFVEFCISRFSRVYSVVLPAIAVTVLVDVLVLRVTPSYHALELRSSIPAYQYAGFAKYTAMSLLFGNQLWSLREPLFSNSVYWSMCLEVYYYALFASAFYFRGIPRIAGLAVVLAIIGPEPLLRFHLWLFGAAVYLLHRHIYLPKTLARGLFVVTLVMLAYDLSTDLNLRIDDYLDSITTGAVSAGIWRRFVGDTFTGAIIAANIMATRYCSFTFGKVGVWFTYLGSFSFTLYLMHVPLLRFFTGYFIPSGPLPLLSLVLGSAWLISRMTEMQKDELRRHLRLFNLRFSKAAQSQTAISHREP